MGNIAIFPLSQGISRARAAGYIPSKGKYQMNWQLYRLVWAEPKTIATSAILYLIKLVSYHFILELPCFYDTNRKPLKRAF
jgi:hypothetical protein